MRMRRKEKGVQKKYKRYKLNSNEYTFLHVSFRRAQLGTLQKLSHNMSTFTGADNELKTALHRVLVFKNAGILIPNDDDNLEIEIKAKSFKGESIFTVFGDKGSGRSVRWSSSKPPTERVINRGQKILRDRRRKLSALSQSPFWPQPQQEEKEPPKKKLTFSDPSQSEEEYVTPPSSRNLTLEESERFNRIGKKERRRKSKKRIRKVPTPYPSPPESVMEGAVGGGEQKDQNGALPVLDADVMDELTDLVITDSPVSESLEEKQEKLAEWLLQAAI